MSYVTLATLLITKARLWSVELFGKEFQELLLPYIKEQEEFLYQTGEEWQVALHSITVYIYIIIYLTVPHCIL